jgi:hypothetical protein
VSKHPQKEGSDSWKSTIAGMAKAWSEVYPDEDFDYHFEDDTIARFYKDDQDIERLRSWATGLAIFISCLDLLGLAIYITDQQTKEIGIRKIVGASVGQLVALLSAGFLKFIVLAFSSKPGEQLAHGLKGIAPRRRAIPLTHKYILYLNLDRFLVLDSLHRILHTDPHCRRYRHPQTDIGTEEMA